MSTRLDQQRLAFGRVAALYDRARPSYPKAAIDAVIESSRLTAPAQVLEVGAGTGKATVLLAQRGMRVIGLEPSREMAGVARARCAAYPGVKIIETQFESWRARRRFPALVSAAAWHWIDPDLRYELARRALAPRARLAAIWTFPEWGPCRLRPALSEAYRAAAPQLAADFPMHPDSCPSALAGDWQSQIESSAGFTAPKIKIYPWTQRYSSDTYIALLQTHQDHILLEPGPRTRLLAAIGEAIDCAGGAFVMHLATRVCLATRV